VAIVPQLAVLSPNLALLAIFGKVQTTRLSPSVRAFSRTGRGGRASTVVGVVKHTMSAVDSGSSTPEKSGVNRPKGSRLTLVVCRDP
jgi:hypothetical protein